MAYGEVTGPGFVHAQVFVEAHCVVVSVHVEFNAGGSAGNLLYALHNLVEEEKAQAGSLILRQNVKFFKMEKLGSVIELPFKTEGDIAFFTIEVEDMTRGCLRRSCGTLHPPFCGLRGYLLCLPCVSWFKYT